MKKMRLLPLLVILIALVLAGFVSFGLSPKKSLEMAAKIDLPKTDTPNIEFGPAEPLKIAQAPKPAASFKSISPSTSPSADGSPKPSPVNSQTPQPSPTPQTSTSPLRQPADPTPSPTPETQTVNIEIKASGSSSNFSTAVNEGMNVCEAMQKAKDEGKIQSITFDDSYLAAFKSKYVLEINGLQNNWTFTVNGASPLGCSLIQLKPNDSIVWTFG